MFRLGYNTNGLAHHRLLDAFELLASLGYEAVAVTPDVGELDLFDLDAAHVARLRRRADELGLALAVETGARYMLDPRRKHFPTLMEDGAGDRARRVDFLRRSVDLAVDLGADLVSIWAGAAPGGAIGDRAGAAPGAHPELWDRLLAGVVDLLDHARGAAVRIGFEPEPGMFLERPGGYRELRRRLGERGGELGLTLDIGHLLVTGDVPIGDQIRQLGPNLVHVHLDDAREGVHEHLMLGAGVLDLHDALTALLEVDYGGVLALELSRDSHRGAFAAQESLRKLRHALAELNPGR